jgi:uncharacterized protein YbjT (DUF2867 family)
MIFRIWAGYTMTQKLVTIFGGGGFLGRYVVQELLASGVRVRVAERNPVAAVRVKTQGNLGQVQMAAADVTNAASVARAVTGADAVINMVGILKGNFEAVHVRGAANVAQAAAKAGAGALVHVSAIGADEKSTSAYGASKGQGEAAVRAAYAAATIIRPSIIFGPEDQFTNRFAALIGLGPVVPVIGGATKFQPAYVVDAAKAIAAAALDAAQFGGKTFELGGPQQMSMAEINSWIARATGRNPVFAPVPDTLACALATLTGWAPGAPITRDQWKMLQKDNVVAEGAVGFAAFGIAPLPLAAVAEGWLTQYRKHGRFGTQA